MSAKYNAQLTILNVHEEFMDKQEMTMLRVSVEQMQERFRDIAVKCREQMQKLVTSVGLDDLQVEYLIREGKAEDVIVKVAEEIDSQTEEPTSWNGSSEPWPSMWSHMLLVQSW
jgi:hypothetical protein